jgi:hypothetical protein
MRYSLGIIWIAALFSVTSLTNTAHAAVCPATNVVGTIQWFINSAESTTKTDDTECVASLRLKQTIPAPGIPSTVHFLKHGQIVASERVEITGAAKQPFIIDSSSSKEFDSVIVMANYN